MVSLQNNNKNYQREEGILHSRMYVLWTDDKNKDIGVVGLPRTVYYPCSSMNGFFI